MSTFNLKLAKQAPDFYEEPRVTAGKAKRDPLEGYRDFRDSRDSAFYVPTDEEQIQANVANATHIP